MLSVLSSWYDVDAGFLVWAHPGKLTSWNPHLQPLRRPRKAHMPRANMSVILLSMLIALACYQQSSQSRYASTLADAMNRVDSFFVEPIDRRRLFEASMRGMIRELDPYSGYIGPDEFVQWLSEIEQAFGGIGVVIDIDPETNRPVILTARPGSPAYDTGIRAGDIITSIAGTDTAELDAGGPVRLIRGEPGTDIVLGILSPGDEEPRDVTLTRAVIPIESVMGYWRGDDDRWVFRVPENSNLGYIWLESFGEDTAEELRKALEEVADCDGLVLDLRANAGGLLDAAVEVCDMFVDQGEIVTVRSRYSERVYDAKPGNEKFSNKPVVVLIDRYSASASEIFAACLQDHHLATVMGERSWGKGTVQSVIEMEGGRSALRLTTATYWRPSGTNIHRKQDAGEEDTWGVMPDEGFLLDLPQEEYLEMLRHRRDRFTGSTASGDEEPAEENVSEQPNESAGAEKEDGPFVDRQLEMAVKHLLERLETGSADGETQRAA